MTDKVVVLSTAGSQAEAARIAEELVERRLAACVNVHGRMMSTYRWKGAVEREAERQVVIKTTRDRLSALEARLRELHPYELPEFVLLTPGAGAAYETWVVDQTRT